MSKEQVPHPGQILSVIVEKVDPTRVTVRLPDGSPGQIQRKELTWNRRIQRPHELVKSGQQVQVMVLELNRRYGLWELSLRQAQGNPWTKVAGRLQVGSVVRGWVVSVLDDRVYVQVVPGVNALLSADQIPLKDGQKIKDALWIGDKVVGTITYLNIEKEQMTVSLREYLAQVERIKANVRDRTQARKQVAGELPAETAPGIEEDQAELEAADAWVMPGPAHSIRRVLLIDDEQEFSKPFGDWLRGRGYEVEVAETGPTGCDRALSDASIDLVFLDVDLIESDGLEIAREIQDVRPSLPVVIITGLDWLQRDLDLKELNIVDIFLKPPDFDQIETLLRDLAHGRWVRKVPLQRFRGQQSELIRQSSGPTLKWKSWQESTQKILDELVVSTEATCALMFDMDPVTYRVKIENQAGKAEIDSGYDWDQARYSPIRDVIQSEEEILEPDAQSSRVEKRFRKLLSLLPFTSCIGLPVLVPEQRTRYGLFLFHTLPQHFNDNHFAQALLAARALSVAAERQSVIQFMQSLQQFIVVGQLGSGMVHEIGNHLTGVEQCVKNLQLIGDELCPGEKLTPGEVEDFKTETNSLGRINDELRELIHFYLGLIRPGEADFLDVNRILAGLKDRMRREARESRVDVVLELGSDLPPVWAAQGRLQQAFLNVMLNAMQQIKQHNPKGGLLVISTQMDKTSGPLPIKITFADDGPGIHHELFEHIFERGVSTRQGPGLGLFITRSLIESVGGRIRVEDSTLFLGSSFLIELPAVPIGGEGS